MDTTPPSPKQRPSDSCQGCEMDVIAGRLFVHVLDAPDHHTRHPPFDVVFRQEVVLPRSGDVTIHMAGSLMQCVYSVVYSVYYTCSSLLGY